MICKFAVAHMLLPDVVPKSTPVLLKWHLAVLHQQTSRVLCSCLCRTHTAGGAAWLETRAMEAMRQSGTFSRCMRARSSFAS